MEDVCRIEESGIIAIIRGIGSDLIPDLAYALYNGGIRLMEVAFDNADKNYKKTSQAIETVRKKFGSSFLVGAGTVTSKELVHVASDCGAQFLVSPNCNAGVISETKKLNLISIPGAMTPTEVLTAHEAGADYVKIFPADIIGASYIKALMGPMPHIKKLAFGGINLDNIDSFIKAGCVGVGIGAKLSDKELIRAGKYDEITFVAEEFVKALEKARKK